MRDVLSVQLLGDLSRLARVEIGIQQRHAPAIARAACQNSQQGTEDHGDGPHGGEPRRAERLQALDERVHPARSSTTPTLRTPTPATAILARRRFA